MTVQLLWLILGLAMVVAGAEFLVDGASSVARKMGISEFVIGLTIVGFGTSTPELVVSVTGALQGNSDVAIGNVLGSNIFNVLFILGLTALLFPIPITHKNQKRDIPIMMMVSFLLILLGMSKTLLGVGSYNGLSRLEGIVFLILFGAYIYYSFKTDQVEANDAATSKALSVPMSVLAILGGLALLIFGGRLFVDSAVQLARDLGVSDKFIAVTLLAMGTSLPELATSIVAVVKKSGQLALGNILGSNVFNILFILGCSSLIRPMSFAGMNMVDMMVLALSAVLVFTSAFLGKRNRVDRLDATIMLACMAVYMGWLFKHL